MNLEWLNANKVEHWIPMDQCKDGYLYRIAARNAVLGIYRAERQGFEISRVKCNIIYRCMEYHWDADPKFGTAKPTTEIERAPNFKDEHSFLEYIKERTITLSKENT